MSRLKDIKFQEDDLYELFNKIHLSEFTEDDLLDVFNLVLTLYNSNQRLSYFVVSKYVIEKYREDISVTILLENQFNIFLDIVSDSAKITKQYSQKDIENVIRLTLKILDHIKLEQIRLDNLLTNEEALFENFFNEANNKLNIQYNISNNKISEKYKDLDGRIDRIDTSVVTILGIFTAITISVFGTLNVFGSVIISANNLSIPRLLFTLSFIALIIFDIIFLLLFTTSKFTKINLENSSLSKNLVSSKQGSISTYKSIIDNIKKDFKNFYLKYPYVLYFNALMFSMMALSLFIWYINKYHITFL